jgi:hypothetical protein
MFDREVYFDAVRASLFSGSLTQQQVDGQEAILADWEGTYEQTYDDLRFLAYALATTIHETASTMWPIEEYGAPTCGGAEYAKVDPETGNRFYGRGYVQLTWKDNYRSSTSKLGLSGEDDLVWHPEKALDPFIAGHIMFRGMLEGWFRSDSKGRQTLTRYFNDTTDDAYTAREIINGDKSKVPSWSNGVSIGNLIKGYHTKFLAALIDSWIEPAPEPAPEPTPEPQVVTIYVPEGIDVQVVHGPAPST